MSSSGYSTVIKTPMYIKANDKINKINYMTQKNCLDFRVTVFIRLVYLRYSSIACSSEIFSRLLFKDGSSFTLASFRISSTTFVSSHPFLCIFLFIYWERFSPYSCSFKNFSFFASNFKRRASFALIVYISSGESTFYTYSFL